MNLNSHEIPKNQLYEIFADARKIGSTVASSESDALTFARRATTRKTYSKLDEGSDYAALTVRLFGTEQIHISTLETAFASEQKSIPFGTVSVPDIGTLSFETARYPYVGAPLAIETWVHASMEPPEPFAMLTSAFPWGAKEDLEDDEVIMKTYAENESLREPLLASGYFQDTAKRIKVGFTELEIWRILPKFIHEFRSKNTHWTNFVAG